MTEETCRDVRALLSELLDDELEADARARALEHLHGCEACRAELDALTRTLEALRALPREEAPADLLQRIEGRLGRPGAAIPGRKSGRFRLRRHAVAMLLAVGILVGIIRVLPHGPAPLHAPETRPPLGRLEADRPAPADKNLSKEREKLAASADRVGEQNREAKPDSDLRDSRRDAAAGASRDEQAMTAAPAAPTAPPAEPAPAAPAESARRQAVQKKGETFATRQNAPAIAGNEAAPAPDPSSLFTSPRPEPAWAAPVRDALLHRPAQTAAAWRRLTDAQRAAVLDAWTRVSHPQGARAELDTALAREPTPEIASMLRAFRARTP